MINREDSAFIDYQSTRTNHWDSVAFQLRSWKGWGRRYHARLEQVYRSIIPLESSILELGCGNGSLLASLQPSHGVGIDLSRAMLCLAKSRYPDLNFFQADAHGLPLSGTFDVIILSDLINELWDLQAVLREVRRLAHDRTRVIINSYSRMWELPLRIAEALGLAKPSIDLNWFTVDDVQNLLDLEGFESVRQWEEILLPLPVPLLEGFSNRFLVRFWPFRHLALTNFIVARPLQKRKPPEIPIVSVIIPARNESGNIQSIINRVPELGGGTELVFIEGHSIDDTYDTIQREIQAHPDRTCQLFRQTGEGKGDAVRLGFEKATGEILIILDADLTVPPEALPRFVDVLISGNGDFVNGVRLVYPVEDEAMRYLNLMGNKFFSLALSWLFGQTIKDTLCGTKGLCKSDYLLLAANRNFFGEFDPFGDFDLLLGAARFNMKLVDVPIRYRRRTYGETNIQRWKHGVLLLKMLVLAARRLKFV